MSHLSHFFTNPLYIHFLKIEHMFYSVNKTYSVSWVI
nr:MAG TPA: hypothetical protein [Caudoviricetes sp.]